MENIVNYYLNNITNFVECGNLFKVDRKTVKRQVIKQYPEYKLEQFRRVSSKIHNNFYSYSKTEKLLRFTDKVTITCPTHGEFKQSAWHHMHGYKCEKCGRKEVANKKSHNTEYFIQLAREKHKDTYDYSKVTYVNNRSKVVIGCRKHGNFLQSPDDHKQGKGCPVCSIRNGYKNYKSKTVPKVYLIKCEGNNEEFLKIGVSNKDINKRFIDKKEMPYKISLIKYFYPNSIKEAFDLEGEILDVFYKYRYEPKLFFSGHTECLDISLTNEIVAMLE